MASAWKGGDSTVFTAKIREFAPNFNDNNEHDVQEFLLFLLEGLHDDLNRVRAPPSKTVSQTNERLSLSEKAAEAWNCSLRSDSSIIVDIFAGQLQSTLTCTYCGNCSVTFEKFWDISLSIPEISSNVNLLDCFELFTKAEVLDGTEKPTCEVCQCRRKCIKSYSIQKFPKVLVIHLKKHKPSRKQPSKRVGFPIRRLNLSRFAARREAFYSYNLYAIAIHSGTTLSGHYIATCKNPYNGEWIQYNDSKVSSTYSLNVASSDGYLFFYEQNDRPSSPEL